MKTFAPTLAASCLALAIGSAAAQPSMKKDDAMAKNGMDKPMTMQECKDHMAMTKKEPMAKDSMKKDDAMMKKDTMCADMMKKDEAMTMKKDGMKK